MKLSGAGNDFVIIDNRQGTVQADARFVERVCARRLSVGADGLLLVENPSDPAQADFRMRYFNADGGEAETCGNGARCISRFAHVNGIAGENMRFETLAGVYESEIRGERVRVQMSDPKDMRLDFPLALRGGEFKVSFANTGVPHVVFFCESVDDVDVVGLGRQTRYHADFAPAGTNANFVTVTGRNSMRIRTYERGVEDETLACGTGSIAAAILGGARGVVQSPVTLRTQGGFDLTVSFELVGESAQSIHLEGDARIVYVGELRQDAWDY
ncbi:diaminopimelate epimerase [Candidatus Poribacteria bacterium]|nr:diaminopimelate epimerase [Candidatus Poribacteria bacterium]